MKIGIVGGGIVGLSTAFELLRHGEHEVRCYDPAPMTARSKGDSRIFRLYHRDVELISLAQESLARWRQWENLFSTPLVGRQGLLVRTPDAESLAALMRSAGAAAETPDQTALSPLTSSVTDGPLLFDPSGGTIRVDAVAQALTAAVPGHPATIRNIELRGEQVAVISDADEYVCDALLIAAGAATPAIAASVGITVPAERHHHARFTFQLADATAEPPCLLDRRDGFSTYGQSPRPGLWAVGGHFEPQFTEWGLGAEAASEHSRKAVCEYVATYLDDVDPTPIDETRCDFDAGGVDGLYGARNGAVLTLWGDNLFKFGPVLGHRLAEALVTGGVPRLPWANNQAWDL